MPKLAKQALEMIVKLQGASFLQIRLPSTVSLSRVAVRRERYPHCRPCPLARQVSPSRVSNPFMGCALHEKRGLAIKCAHGSRRVNRRGQRVGFFRALWRALRQLFHETTGTRVFAAGSFLGRARLCGVAERFAPLAVRSVRQASALMLAMFGLTSFRSSRRVR